MTPRNFKRGGAPSAGRDALRPCRSSSSASRPARSLSAADLTATLREQRSAGQNCEVIAKPRFERGAGASGNLNDSSRHHGGERLTGSLTCRTEDVPKAQLGDSDSDPARPISASIGAAHASGVASLAWRRSCAQLLWSQSFSPQWCWQQPKSYALQGATSTAGGEAAAKTADFRRWS